jgi:predicted transcriptional regulator
VSESSAFRFESDLVEVLRENPPAVLNLRNSTVQVLKEIQVGMRIPDLLIVCSKIQQPTTSVKLTYFDCTIIAATMQSGGMSVAELADAMFASEAEIAKRVVRLVRLGLLDQQQDAQVRMRRRALPGKPHVVAVEAKLVRWKEALSQARRYLAFANEAYIAMPGATVRRNVAALTACAEAGVGVIAVDEIDADVLLPAERRQLVSAEWVRVVWNAVGLAHTRANIPSNASRHAR